MQHHNEAQISAQDNLHDYLVRLRDTKKPSLGGPLSNHSKFTHANLKYSSLVLQSLYRLI